MNGNTEGDKEGEYTRLEGDKGTVIDYVIRDDKISERIVRLEVHIDSDHFLIIVKLRGKRKKEKRFNKDIKIKRAGRSDRSIEGMKQFEEKIKNWKMGEGNVNEEIGLMSEETKRVLREIDRKEMGEEEFTSSWDEECKEKKKEVRKKLRKWRKGKSSGGEYNKKKNLLASLAHSHRALRAQESARLGRAT